MHLPGILGISRICIPGIPGMPGIPGIPGIPGLLGISIPGVSKPCMPGILGISIPGIPGIQILDMPSIPGRCISSLFGCVSTLKGNLKLKSNFNREVGDWFIASQTCFLATHKVQLPLVIGDWCTNV